MLILLIIILILLIIILLKKKNRTPTRQIGNTLSRYFGNFGLAMYYKKDFVFNEFSKDEFFYKDLPRFIPFRADIYQRLQESGFKRSDISFVENSFWVVENERIESFWLILKPYISKILDGVLKKNNLHLKTANPIIHFRCSDVPFIKNIHYHFVRYSFYKNSIDLLKKSCEFDTITILSCRRHNSNEKNSMSCRIYLDHLRIYLENLGYKIMIECNQELHDFAKLFYAPAVISSGSSFAFMSGFFGGGIFLSEGHFTEEKEPIVHCYDCGPWLKHGYSILHRDVADYHDTEKMFKELMG